MIGVDHALALEHDEKLVAIVLAMIFMPRTWLKHGPRLRLVLPRRLISPFLRACFPSDEVIESSACALHMSAIGGKADIPFCAANVR
jgi:hypothetical protein